VQIALTKNRKKTMTEKRWLELTTFVKNEWVCENIIYPGNPETRIDALSWNGFGMIASKFALQYRLVAHKDSYSFVGWDEDMNQYQAVAPTPWEAAALACGKMLGLIL
jgi:hypothetical protein